MCAFSSTTSSVPRSPRIASAIWFAHRRRGQVDGLFVPEQRSDPLLEREHGRILALLLVADLGPRHRLAHARRRLRLGVGAKIDHLTGI